MAPNVPVETAIVEAINNAPGQRIKHSDLVANLQAQGYRGFGLRLLQMGWANEITATTEVEDNRGVVYLSPAATG